MSSDVPIISAETYVSMILLLTPSMAIPVKSPSKYIWPFSKLYPAAITCFQPLLSSKLLFDLFYWMFHKHQVRLPFQDATTSYQIQILCGFLGIDLVLQLSLLLPLDHAESLSNCQTALNSAVTASVLDFFGIDWSGIFVQKPLSIWYKS